MKFLFFDKALVRGQWQKNVRIAVHSGAILSLDVGVDCDGAEHIEGAAIPAMANVHSHAFQRGFAGLAEYKPKGRSDFWAWREAMYGFSSKMTPEYLKAIAAQLYLECLTNGYSHIGEFHYMHNAHLGHEKEMAEALFSAADEVGIGMTFLPVQYQTAGFDDGALSNEQKAFSLSIESMERVYSSLDGHLGSKHKKGYCFHSLRAVPEDHIRQVLNNITNDTPVHIHIAEQKLEVSDCLKARGKRPVEWLLDTVAVDENWCLIHATHLNDEEVKGIADSGAIVGLCPTTEANLGDGIFPLDDFMRQGGRIAIGSDSHVCRNPLEELRLLEYSQRLSGMRRTVACTDDSPHVGTTLWSQAATGGFKALGVEAGEITVGVRADILIIDTDHPALVAKPLHSVIDSLIFAGGEGAIKHMMVAGEWQVRAGRHEKHDAITERFKSVMRELMA